MKMNLKKYSLMLLMLSITLQMLGSDAKDYTKKVSEKFAVKQGSKLHVENKYGPVHIDAWEKNEISIEVTIRVKTSSQSKADKLFDRIDISIEGDQSLVSAITSFGDEESSSGWWDRMFGDYGSGDYEISYQINAPSVTQLDIENKYGHLHLNSDFVGDAEITNKYGNIYAENIKGDVRIDLGYGDLKIGNIHNLNLEIKYAKARIGDAKRAVVDSKYSNINLGNIEQLRTDTKYDDYDVEYAGKFTNSGKYDDFLFGSAGDCDVSSKYSTIKIGEAQGTINIDGGYNELQIKNSSSSLSSVEVHGKYCQVKMRINHSFSLDFEGSYVTPSLPDDFNSKVYVQDGKYVEIRGSRGTGARTAILARMDYGSLKIVD